MPFSTKSPPPVRRTPNSFRTGAHRQQGVEKDQDLRHQSAAQARRSQAPAARLASGDMQRQRLWRIRGTWDGAGSDVDASAGSKRTNLPFLAGAAVVALFGGAVAGFFAGQRTATPSVPTFRELTFRRGALVAARFAPDPRSAIYSASWEGNPQAVFVSSPNSTESPIRAGADGSAAAFVGRANGCLM